MPPSVLPRWLRLKPVAMCWSSVAIGQQVAGELLDGELVEGHVAIEGVDHPVAPAPHVTLAVGLVAVGVGVAGGVEPADGHAFAVAGRGEQAVDDFLVGVGRGVGEEGVDLGGGGRQTGEIERDAADEGGAAGFGGGREAFAFQTFLYEIVDRVRCQPGPADARAG